MKDLINKKAAAKITEKMFIESKAYIVIIINEYRITKICEF